MWDIVYENEYSVDKNFDKVIDEKDDNFKTDLRFGVISSNYAFSCANCLVSEARDNGIMIVGEKSGGGGCSVIDRLSFDGVYEALSHKALDTKHEIIFFRRERFTEGVEGIDAVQPEYEVDGEMSGDILNHVLSKKYQLTLTCPVNKIFRRDFLLENDLYFTVGLDHEEDEWLPRVISCARCVWFDKGVYYTVRQHAGSLSKIDTPEKTTDKACSKVIIAASGMAYMEKKDLPPETMSLAAEYYWDYLTDACVVCSRLSSAENKKRLYAKLKENKAFFRTSRYLKSKNRRIMSRMFRLLGVRLTVRFIGLRYG